MTSLQQQQQQPEQQNDITWVQNCLGRRLLCTMKDGRQVYGIFMCLDRLNNLIVTDCIERRVISNQDYLIPSSSSSSRTTTTTTTTTTEPTTMIVSRSLPQAMIPGHLLVRIQMTQEEYESTTGTL